MSTRLDQSATRVGRSRCYGGSCKPLPCPPCRFANPAGAKFCGACGASWPSPAPDADSNRRPSSSARSAGHLSGRTSVDQHERRRRAFDGTAPQPPKDAVFRLQDAKVRAYTPPHLAEKILTSAAALEGERKAVTVLFADVAGFTRLAGQLSAEDLHAMMDGCFERLSEAVHRYEGTINQFTGDGIMALFGAPIAHEDHAERPSTPPL